MGEGLACPVSEATAKKSLPSSREKSSPQAVSQPPLGIWDANLGFKSRAWSDLRLGPQALYQTPYFPACCPKELAEGCFFKNKSRSFSTHLAVVYDLTAGFQMELSFDTPPSPHSGSWWGRLSWRQFPDQSEGFATPASPGPLGLHQCQMGNWFLSSLSTCSVCLVLWTWQRDFHMEESELHS